MKMLLGRKILLATTCSITLNVNGATLQSRSEMQKYVQDGKTEISAFGWERIHHLREEIAELADYVDWENLYDNYLTEMFDSGEIIGVQSSERNLGGNSRLSDENISLGSVKIRKGVKHGVKRGNKKNRAKRGGKTGNNGSFGGDPKDTTDVDATPILPEPAHANHNFKPSSPATMPTITVNQGKKGKKTNIAQIGVSANSMPNISSPSPVSAPFYPTTFSSPAMIPSKSHTHEEKKIHREKSNQPFIPMPSKPVTKSKIQVNRGKKGKKMTDMLNSVFSEPSAASHPTILSSPAVVPTSNHLNGKKANKNTGKSDTSHDTAPSSFVIDQPSFQTPSASSPSHDEMLTSAEAMPTINNESKHIISSGRVSEGIPILNYERSARNCDDSPSSIPCAPENLKNLCDKYDPNGDFLACFDACLPSFCCIHDAPPETNPLAPSCNQDFNCRQYTQCYIVWWKLHDTVGPATALRLEQNDDFFTNADEIMGNENIGEVLGQLLFHHFDDAREIIQRGRNSAGEFETEKIFRNKTFWNTTL